MKRKVKSFLIFTLFLLFVNWVYAVNYILPNNSVDAWEIRWWGTTKYTTQWNNAISMWHNYWVIDILPDTLLTYEDLRVSDVNITNVTWAWVHTWSLLWTDTLKLNTYFLDWLSYAWTFSSSNKQHTIWHELWHALWLDHHNISWNVLRSWKWTYTTLWTQDKADYDYLW